MKKILLSFGSIVFAAAAIAGGTGAFFSDSETSTGNTFASGVIDLKVDNESYVTDQWGNLAFSSTTSWSLGSLAGKLFFDFADLKPGDIGEDTISLHVNNNNAWACMDVKETGTPENGQNEPEALVDTTAGPNDGELQNYLQFAFWADDGDNVYEQGEHIFKQGLTKDIFDGSQWALADSKTNVWTGSGPIPGDTVQYIGKAWCFGDMNAAPVPQDGQGKTGENGPLARGTGFSCSGEDVGNVVQSDGVTADVGFSVVQSRNNGDYVCGGDTTPPPPIATSTVTIAAEKIVCDSESDLPNWGAGSPPISSTTAATFLATHPSCHLDPDWSFQWGYSSKPGETGVLDPGGSVIGPAPETGPGYNQWKTFGPTNGSGMVSVSVPDLQGASNLWVREILKPGYVPFSEPPVQGAPDKNDVSAELYCAGDGLNYDNYDIIFGPQPGQTYTCIAFNAPANGTSTPQ